MTGLLALGACGFQPVYGPGGSAEGLRGQVEVADPADREGFELVRQLRWRLGEASSPHYRLDAEIALYEREIGITPDQVTTRFQVDGRVAYSLTRIGTDAILARGTARSFTSYSSTSTTVATLRAREDARDRLMVILADRIVAELLAGGPVWRA